VLVQWLLTKITGPYGKKSTAIEADNIDNTKEALEFTKNVTAKTDDGFKEIDLSR
jgi:hypothetical protein